MKKIVSTLIFIFICFTLIAQIPINGLVAYYPFNGNANDESGNGCNGTVSGPILTTDRFSNSMSAYYFDGINDSIHATLGLYDKMSVSMWFQTPTPINWYPTLFDYGHREFLIMENGDHPAYQTTLGRLKLFTHGDGANEVLATYTPTFNQWHHVVAIYSANENIYKIYLDGVFNNQRTVSTPLNPVNGHTKFGCRTEPWNGDGSYYYIGNLDDIRIYNRTLSDQEILALYNESSASIITTTANPSYGGTTIGDGTYIQGSTVSVIASPSYKWSFTNWMENGVIVSTSSTYTFAASGNRNLIANFIQVQPYVISTSSNPTVGGTISGGGNFYYGNQVNVTATENPGWNFINWTENGNVVSTNPLYSFTVIQDRNLIANFAVQQYNITAFANPNNGGFTIGSGLYNYGTTATINATANTGWNFTNWTENGTIVSTSPDYSFIVTANRNLVANFVQQQFNISTSTNPTNGGTTSGGGIFNYGSQITVTASGNNGWVFISWTENGNVVSTIPNYTFTVTANRTLIANFIIQQYFVNTYSYPTNGGTTSGSGVYDYGTQATVIASTNTGWNFINWTENGNVLSTSPAFTFIVTSNRNLIANFTSSNLLADFTGTPVEGQSPLNVQFTDESSGNPSVWIWDFQNDGINDAFTQNPSFNYTEPGIYSVKLIVINSTAADTTVKNNYITVLQSSIEEGLMAYYPFNGNANDESGNGNNGNVNGATLTTDRFGNSNRAYNFNGTSNFISINNALANFGTSDFTIAGWINMTVYNNGTEAIFSKRNENTYSNFVEFQTNSYKFQGEIDQSSSSNYSVVSSTSNITLNDWYFGTFVRESNTITMYFNGNKEGFVITPIVQNINNNAIANIGRINYGTAYFNGKLDDIRIYNRALSNAEVMSLYLESSVETPEICIVSVTADEHNKVIWEKESSNSIESYNVYRESTQTNVFEIIGSVAYADSSIYLDANSNPTQRPYKYKISAVSNLNNETALSNYHRTIHLTINQGPIGWNIIWSPYEGFPFSTYYIYRGEEPNSLILLDSISGSFTSYTDINPPWGPLYYAIEVVNEVGCNPSRDGEFNRSRSNIQYNGVVGVTDRTVEEIRIYPNPTSDLLNISIPERMVKFGTQILVYNIEGIRLISKKIQEETTIINIENLEPGVYLVHVIYDNDKLVRKLIVY